MTHTDFWKKWINADDFERISLVKDLKITKTFAELYYPKLSRDAAMDVISAMLNSYFEDLYFSLRSDQI